MGGSSPGIAAFAFVVAVFPWELVHVLESLASVVFLEEPRASIVVGLGCHAVPVLVEAAAWYIASAEVVG
jgi:hypothetical protein